MRGADGYNEALFSTVRLEDFVPATHPLRQIRKWINEALVKMDEKSWAMYEANILMATRGELQRLQQGSDVEQAHSQRVPQMPETPIPVNAPC